MDGFRGRSQVVVLAATNRADVLDSALLRPGRFDQQITVHVPDRAGRLAILEIHCQRLPMASDVDLNLWAGRTTGWTGAHLKNLTNRAAIWSARRQLGQVTEEAFAISYDQALLGPARALTLGAEEKERVAYHEAGHVVVAMLTPGAPTIDSVSITPRNRKLSATVSWSETESQQQSATKLRDRLVQSAGGRAAEEIRYGGDIGTGSEDDTEEATLTAVRMVTQWGMSDLGMTNYAAWERFRALEGMPGPAFGEATSWEIDQAVRNLLETSLEDARALLRSHWSAVTSLAEALVVRETLSESEIQDTLNPANLRRVS